MTAGGTKARAGATGEGEVEEDAWVRAEIAAGLNEVDGPGEPCACE